MSKYSIPHAESSWNVMAHGDAREGKRRRNWRMEWVASTLHTSSEHGVSSITTADVHTSAASSRLNWRPPGWFKWTRLFRRKMKSGFCACAITFQTQSTLQLSKEAMKTAVYWDVTLCALAKLYWHFRGPCCNDCHGTLPLNCVASPPRRQQFL